MPDTGNKPLGSDWTAYLPKQMIPAANLLTPQIGAAAAVSIVGIGMASQMWGLWAGAVTSAFDLGTTTGQKLKNAATAPQLGADDVDTLKTIIREKTGATPKTVRLVAAKKEKQPAAVTTGVTAAEAATQADDLKKISGIGPKLEQVLNAMGIRSYVQIAGWSEDDIAKIDDQLKLNGRVSRDDWRGQANALPKSNGGQ